ncbi:protein kinase domain-containing protein [Nostoc sp.]|uniref:protein kinase domain-containing protein n=1 Tax=Nostoc sp. TaxID=1180 RepID=UPI002FFC96B5
MSNQQEPENLAFDNEGSLQTLVRAITFSQGQFSLIILRCNYVALRQRIVERLHQVSPVEICEITLPASVKTLYTNISEQLGDEQPPALMIVGLESVKDIDTVLTSANQVREEFRKNFPFPILLWVNNSVLQKLIRLATDLENWATIIEFENPTDELVNFLQQKSDKIFADDVTPNPQMCRELETARQDLQNRGEVLEAALQASLEFLLGLNDYLHDQIDSALSHYQQSLGFWRQSNYLERQGILLVNIASAYNRQSEKNQIENQRYWQESRNYFQQAIEIFEQAQRSDLVAKHITKLGEVLRDLQAWSELQNLVDKSLPLHQNYGTPLQLAKDYGFLAEVALEQSLWNEAYQLAGQSLQILANIPNLQSDELGLYRFILAKSQQGLGQAQVAINSLETAKFESNHQYNPQLYISILERLRLLYFEQGEYLKAFNIKQEQLQIEQQYGFRAFVGASYLNPQRQAINSIQLQLENSETIAQEIAASGRGQDVKRLLERISGTEHKLIVIHGQSGVGKSSILQAGLIPTLRQEAIGERDALPVLLRTYTDWVKMLGKSLVEAFDKVRDNKSIQLDSIAAILEHLRENANRNLLTVLIFDQFEEFFFVYTNQVTRQSFYEFLRVSLDIPFVKIIFSLREDYLHYLLECERLSYMSTINNDILTKRNRYYLANFSRQEAKNVIHNLTERTHLDFKPELIEQLVNDLAGETREVRPIELQIVGVQLQTDKITTLEKYYQFGTKEKLLQRFLEEVLRDFGYGNENTAELVLYLLTNNNGTRPIKTYADLKAGLGADSDKLDLVLEILVKSGLVSLFPEFYGNRYQLVHDYLVDLIRQKIEFSIKKEIFNNKTFLQTNNISVVPQSLNILLTSKRTIITNIDNKIITNSIGNKLVIILNKLLNQIKQVLKYIFILNPLWRKIIFNAALVITSILFSIGIYSTNQDKISLGLIGFGGIIAGYLAYKNNQQKDNLILQIYEQEIRINQLQNTLTVNEINPRTAMQLDSNTVIINKLLNKRYKIIKNLSSGGFGRTYLAEDMNHLDNPLCVVKHLQLEHKEAQFLEVARRLFKNEADILNILGQHNQIPKLLNYFEDNQQLYLIQEYIYGHSLQEELTYGKFLLEQQVINILEDVLQVLVFVHNHGVIHRDIKPSNLIRREDNGKLVLIDFGAVKQIQTLQYETIAVGTMGYAPPEQLVGHPRLNSDIYALGMIAIQALTGQFPNQLQREENTNTLIWREISKTSHKLAVVLNKMVSYDFRERYQSAKEVLQDLTM